jgi:hypothetical protein
LPGLPDHAGQSSLFPKSTSIIEDETMPTVHAPISTEIKLRLPTEMLEGIELWAAAHSIPRSRAIRLLVYRGLAYAGIPQTEGACETIR